MTGAVPENARAITRVFFTLTFAIYVGVYPYLAALNNPNENVRTYMTMALVEGSTLRIDDVVARHGWVNDMAKIGGAAGGGEPHLYSVKGPAVSYAGIPVYWAFTKIAHLFGRSVPNINAPDDARTRWLRDATFVLRLFVVQLPCFAFLIAFERWLRRATHDVSLRLSTVAAVGLGTNYLAYSHMFASHALTAATAFGAFALATRALNHDLASRTASRAFAAGLLAACTTLLDYHTLPLTLVLAAYAAFAFRQRFALAMLASGLAVPALVLLHFHWRAFGNPLMTGHGFSENEDYAVLLNTGYLGLGVPSPRAAWLLAFSRSFGLFGTAPFLALGLLAIPFGLVRAPVTHEHDARRVERIATATWLLAMALLWTTVSSAINWRGGWTIGPRYLGAAPPFFAYGAVTALEQIAQRKPHTRELATSVAAGAALAGVVQTGVVSMFVSSLPEEITRPLVQLIVPLLRQGHTPYNVFDILGIRSAAPWAILVLMLLAAAIVSAFAGVARSQFIARAAVIAVVAAILTLPVLVRAPGMPENSAALESAAARVAFLRDAWEPKGH
jgi:hypothetical protein